MHADEEYVFTTETAAAWLTAHGVTVKERAVRNWCATGRIRSRRWGRGYRIALSELRRLLREMTGIEGKER